VHGEMNKLASWLSMFIIIQCVLVVSCSRRPGRVDTFNSPDDEASIIVEMYDGQGAISSNYANVYLMARHENKSSRLLILSGEYLVLSNVIWINNSEVYLCMSAGSTATFRNEATITIRNWPRTVRSHLLEHCQI
jgi:hypothetical protein